MKKFTNAVGETLELTDEEIANVESVTGLRGQLAVDEFSLLMVAEDVWPRQGEFKRYLRGVVRRSKKRGD